IKAQYKILDGYLVETSWGRGKSKYTVECEIEYESDDPVFRIRFEENSQQYTIKLKEYIYKVENEYLRVSTIFLINLYNSFYNKINQPVLQEVQFNIQDKNYLVD